jgi:Ca-activated chloride channel family protein
MGSAHNHSLASPRVRLVQVPYVLFTLGLALGIVAMAKPVTLITKTEVSEGLEILFCLDISSSMAEKDMDPNRDRLSIAKEAILDFLDRRPNDRVALLLFARYPDLVCPMTTDQRAFREFIDRSHLVEKDGNEDATGIGAALARAGLALRGATKGKSLVILLTDGEENVATILRPHEIAPGHSGQLLSRLELPVYGIALGSGRTEHRGQMIEIDVRAVEAVCKDTGGQFAKAAAARELALVYEAIDKAQPSPKARTFETTRDVSTPFLFASLLLQAAAAILLSTWLRVMPPC